MKRLLQKTLPVFLSIALALPLGGCGLLNALPSATPAPTPVPSAAIALALTTPEPTSALPPELLVYGADDSAAFRAGVSDAANSAGVAVTFVPGGVEALAAAAPEGPAAAIVYLCASAGELPHTRLPLFVFAANGQTVPSAVPHLTYQRKGADETALELAIGWPPHETPVRLLGLFTSTSSDAYALWCAAADAGRVYPKDVFFLEDQPLSAASAWLAEQMRVYYPGMLDGVFAETGALAIAALHQEQGQGRDDFEIFSAATDADAPSFLSAILPAAVGADEAQAGSLCVNAALSLLAGETAENADLTPTTFQFAPTP